MIGGDVSRAQHTIAPAFAAECGVFNPAAPGDGGMATLTSTPKAFLGASPNRTALLIYNAAWIAIAVAPGSVQPEINAPSSLTIPPASSRAICGTEAKAEWSGVAETGVAYLHFWEISK
jgi:hypothetical protein